MKRILFVLLICLTPSLARAQVIDLTILGASFIDAAGAHWYQGTTFGGSEPFTPFLRLQGSMVERGFNTDFRPLPPDAVGNTTTRSITLGSFLPRILSDATGSHLFYTLFLDVNESSTNGDNYLSLDSMTVYAVPAASGGALSSLSAIAAAGTVRYDMDQPSNQVVLLDGNLVPGSGAGDLEIDIPVSKFDGVAPGDFIYVFMHLGNVMTVGTRKYGASGGFEELRAFPPPATGVDEASPGGTRPWIRIVGGPSSVRFRYFVPGAGRTRLRLYDVHGRAIASISSSGGNGGVREVPILSLPNASGFSSGIYFYEFQWNDARQSGKVAVLK